MVIIPTNTTVREDEPFFKRSNGEYFKIKRRTTEKGNTTYHCNALNEPVIRLRH